MNNDVLKDKHGNIIREPANCNVCGEVYDASILYDGPRPGECFTCWFWRGVLKSDAEDTESVVIADGYHYAIEPEPPPGKTWAPRGFGGARFDILFHDGRSTTTHNLWHQGEIPPYWRGKFSDNAVFLKKEGGQYAEENL